MTMFVGLCLSEAFVSRDAIRAAVLIPVILKKSRLVNLFKTVSPLLLLSFFFPELYIVFLANTSKLAPFLAFRQIGFELALIGFVLG